MLALLGVTVGTAVLSSCRIRRCRKVEDLSDKYVAEINFNGEGTSSDSKSENERRSVSTDLIKMDEVEL